jgi:L,D-transpeptidase ErfK/SrfK
MRRAILTLAVLMPCVVVAAPGDAQAAGLPAPWHWDRIVGLSHWHTCQPGDTLRDLADRYGVEVGPLGRVNRWPVDGPIPAGSRVWVGDARIRPIRPGSGLLINLPEGRLDVVLDGKHQASWPITIGAPDWPTPVGRFTLEPPVRDPSWHVPASIRTEFARHGRSLPPVVPPGPGNPLGIVWMGLGRDSLGIHAAPGPRTIHGSHGCLRLAPEHAWQLALWWRPGLRVDIVYQREKRLTTPNGAWLEVHPDPYGRMAFPPAMSDDAGKREVAAVRQDALGLPIRLPKQGRQPAR